MAHPGVQQRTCTVTVLSDKLRHVAFRGKSLMCAGIIWRVAFHQLWSHVHANHAENTRAHVSDRPRCVFSERIHNDALQDFPVRANIIWNQWSARKMSAAQCAHELVRCRDRIAPSCLQALDVISRRETLLDLESEMVAVQTALEERQHGFINHPAVEDWMRQFLVEHYGIKSRFMPLALLGGTQIGKTSKAMSLFSVARTLKVSCQGLPNGVLPSLSNFDRHRHRAILFDEARTDQVLCNRELFQSSQYAQKLSQSLCNQHSYGIWNYGTAMILCSNLMPTCVAEGLCPEDAEWMETNIVCVRLAPGQRWYLGVQRTDVCVKTS